MKKRIILAKMIVGCLILASGCGDDDKVETNRREGDIVVNTITVNEIVLTEETLVEETIKGW